MYNNIHPSICSRLCFSGLRGALESIPACAIIYYSKKKLWLKWRKQNCLGVLLQITLFCNLIHFTSTVLHCYCSWNMFLAVSCLFPFLCIPITILPQMLSLFLFCHQVIYLSRLLHVHKLYLLHAVNMFQKMLKNLEVLQALFNFIVVMTNSSPSFSLIFSAYFQNKFVFFNHWTT